MEQFGNPNSLTTEEDIFEFTGTDQEDNLVQRLVMLAPHDFLALNDEGH